MNATKVLGFLAAGWAKPKGLAHRHFFPEGKANSLCGRWTVFAVARGDVDSLTANPTDCVECNGTLRDLLKSLRHGLAVQTKKTVRDMTIKSDIWGTDHV